MPQPTASVTATAPATPVVGSDGACRERFPAGLTTGQVVAAKFVCIETPAPGSELATAAGTVRVTGWVAGAFEQNVVVELRDADGAVLAFSPVTATGADLGLFAARWELALPIATAPTTPRGSVRAFTTSPRDGSVEVAAEVAVRFAP